MDFKETVNIIATYSIKTLIFMGTLSVLVILHELGHFISARFAKVKVLEFSFGMGKKLFEKKIGETLFQFRIVPMGGFIKMAGEDGESGDLSDPKEGDFYFASPFKRLLIVVSGPIMNLLLAIVTFWIVFFVSGQDLIKPVVGFLEKNSIAYKAGIRSKDVVSKINGQTISSIEDAYKIIHNNPGQKIELLLNQNNTQKQIELIPELLEIQDLFGDSQIIGSIGLNPFQTTIIGAVIQQSAAEKSGLIKGDRIFSIDDKEIVFREEFLKIVKNNPDKKMPIKWMRNNKSYAGEITPYMEKELMEGTKDQYKKIGKIGVMLIPDKDYIFHQELSLLKSLKISCVKLFNITSLTLKAIKKMFFGGMSKDSLMGPLRLASVVNDAAEGGFITWLFFLGFISHQLTIMNLLPFPALDGGHSIFFILEIIFKKPINHKIQDICNRIGFTLLISLFVFVLINDIVLNFR